MTLPNRTEQRAQDCRCQVDALRPEASNRADRLWLIIEPSLKNLLPSEMGLLSDFIVAKLRECRATAQLEILNTEQERFLKERRTA
jgi:hypothetical protein